MDAGEKIALWGVITTGAGVLVTGFFSYLVYRATQTTADLAKATYDLSIAENAKQVQRELEFKKAMRLLYKGQLQKKTREILYALTSIDWTHIYNSLRAMDEKNIGVPPEEIAKYFDLSEVEIINKASLTFEGYLRNYLKEGYSGEEGALVTYADQPILAFGEMKEMLEKI